MNAIVPPGIHFPVGPDTGAPIPVATATAGFVGYAPGHPGRSDGESGQPVLVRSWLEFRERFGGVDGEPFLPGCLLAHAVRGFFDNGGGRAYIVAAPPPASWRSRDPSNRFRLTETEVEDLLGLPRPGVAPGHRRGAAALEACDEVCAVAVPDLMAGLVRREPLRPDESGRCPGCGGFLTGPVPRCPRCKRGGMERVSAEARDSRLALIAAAQAALVGQCERMGDRIAVLDGIPGFSAGEMARYVQRAGFPCERGHAALYHPWLHTMRPGTRDASLCPPCGHVLGAWAWSDEQRGVHHTPANLRLEGVQALDVQISETDHGLLNGYGINALRAFPARGVQVWGARTLAADPEWRYLAVRRVMSYLRRAVESHMQWLVFEPNDPQLWDRITDHLSAFLTGLWREGRIAGATPQEGFLVRCDEALNPTERTELGLVTTEIRVAPLKPAEFLVFHLHQTHGAAVSSTELAAGPALAAEINSFPALAAAYASAEVEWLPTPDELVVH